MSAFIYIDLKYSIDIIIKDSNYVIIRQYTL